MPRRIQVKRTKGWRMPARAVYVGRPTRWGNPYRVQGYGRAEAVRLYEEHLEGLSSALQAARVAGLEGRDLACWCRVDEACHADILLRLANP